MATSHLLINGNYNQLSLSNLIISNLSAHCYYNFSCDLGAALILLLIPPSTVKVVKLVTILAILLEDTNSGYILPLFLQGYEGHWVPAPRASRQVCL